MLSILRISLSTSTILASQLSTASCLVLSNSPEEAMVGEGAEGTREEVRAGTGGVGDSVTRGKLVKQM